MNYTLTRYEPSSIPPFTVIHDALVARATSHQMLVKSKANLDARREALWPERLRRGAIERLGFNGLMMANDG